MNNQIRYYQEKLQFEIDPSDLFKLLQSEKKYVPLDARTQEAFEKERIPGAINIPHRTMSSDSTAHLDRNNIYVCYCDGIGCNASTKGALNMAKLGFNVLELIGGLQWWIIDGYATEGEESSDGAAISCAC